LKDEPKPSFNQVPLFVSHTLTSDSSVQVVCQGSWTTWCMSFRCTGTGYRSTWNHCVL